MCYRLKQQQSKLHFTSLGYVPALASAPENASILLATQGNIVWGASLFRGITRKVVDLTQILSSVSQLTSKVKTYDLDTHITRPDLITIATNHGYHNS